jgi:hypothetical protein
LTEDAQEKTALLKLGQPKKAEFLILATGAGIVMVPLRPDRPKAISPIVCNSLPLSKSTLYEVAISLKACDSIVITEAGIVMVSIRPVF